MSPDQRFSTSLRGYTVSEVDTFVGRLTDQITALEEERADLASELERARSELERARSDLQEARDSLGDYRSAATRYVERVRALEALIVVGAREIAERMHLHLPAPAHAGGPAEFQSAPDEPESEPAEAPADAPEPLRAAETQVMDRVETSDEFADQIDAAEAAGHYAEPTYEEQVSEPVNDEDAVG